MKLAIREFQERIGRKIPTAEIVVSNPLGGEDASLLVYLPKRTNKLLDVISGTLIDIEDKYGVSVAYTPLTKDQ